jgi:uncharacterized membrane protein
MFLPGGAASAVTATFLASLVEATEAFTIVLAVGTVRGWHAATAGTVCALLSISSLIALLGPALGRVPIGLLQTAVGALLLLFGLRWLRKAILRYGGLVTLHDEAAAFSVELARLHHVGPRGSTAVDWLAAISAFNAVLLEGTEVAFIVLAMAAGRGLVWPCAMAAVAAGAVVATAGAILHRPLARVPENLLKFSVGILLSSCGIFWVGEGLGIAWPGDDLAILACAAAFALAATAAVRIARAAAEPTQ